MKTRTWLAMFGMIVSTFAIFIKLMIPSKIQFIIEGNIVEINRVPSIFNATDVLLISGSCFILGASLVYLLQNHDMETVTKPDKWDELIKSLEDDDESRLVQIVVDNDGTIFQSQLVDESGFSKSKVSIVLDRLEAREILERRRHGMSNVVILK